MPASAIVPTCQCRALAGCTAPPRHHITLLSLQCFGRLVVGAYFAIATPPLYNAGLKLSKKQVSSSCQCQSYTQQGHQKLLQTALLCAGPRPNTFVPLPPTCSTQVPQHRMCLAPHPHTLHPCAIPTHHQSTPRAPTQNVLATLSPHPTPLRHLHPPTLPNHPNRTIQLTRGTSSSCTSSRCVPA
jgi:hypothetical protein